MKKAIIQMIALCGTATALIAGPVSSGKSAKVVVVDPPPAAGCACFDGGWTVNPYGLYMLTDSDSEDDVFGLGVSVDYFFSRYAGISMLAQWADTDSQTHNYGVDFVLRYPITSVCIAPYVFGGSGVHTNSATEFILRGGAGLDWRFTSCYGIFADWTYTSGGGDLDDYQVIRLGAKITF